MEKRKITEDKRIPAWKLTKFVNEHSNNKKYKSEVEDNGNSEWDRGYKACLDELKDFLEEFL